MTKVDMAKRIITALYNLDHMVAEGDRLAWIKMKKLARKPKPELESKLEKANKVLEGRNII